MKLKTIIAMVFILLIAVVPTVSATGSDNGNVNSIALTNAEANTDNAKEIVDSELAVEKISNEVSVRNTEQKRTNQYFNNNEGAKIRVMQLHKQVMKNHAGGDIIIEYISENYPDADVSELELIKENINDLANEAESVSLEELTKEESLAKFEAIKEEAKALSAKFKELVHEIVPEEDLEALRAQVKEQSEEFIKAKQAEIKAKVQEQNKERMINILNDLEIDIEEVKAKLQSGEMTSQEARMKLQKHISLMNQDKKEHLKNTANELRARTSIAQQRTMNAVSAEDIEAFRAKIQSRQTLQTHSLASNTVASVN